jgi:hypothetical protein
MRGRVRLYLVVCASIVMGSGGFSPGAFLDFVPPALGCPAAVTTTPSISGVFNSSDQIVVPQLSVTRIASFKIDPATLRRQATHFRDLAGSTADKAETRILLELATEYEEQADQASAGQMDAPR